MKEIMKVKLALLSLVVALSACGGGGDSVYSPPSGHELARYVGNYHRCTGHENIIHAVTENPNGTLSTAARSNIYQNSGCVGPIVATVSFSLPTTASFVSNIPEAQVFDPVSKTNSIIPVDKINISFPARTTTMTGKTVVVLPDGASCVVFTDQKICYEHSIPAITVSNQGMALVDDKQAFLDPYLSGFTFTENYFLKFN